MTFLAILLIALFLSSTGVATGRSNIMAYAQQAINSGPLISVWSPAVSSGNITDPNLLPGDTFSLSVNITNSPQYDFYSFDLGFNPSVIQLVNATLRGTVFYQHTIYQSVFNYTFTPGVLHVVVEGGITPQGNGILLNTFFTVLITSLSNLRVTNSVLALQGIQIDHRDTGGCFNNRPPLVPQSNFTIDSSPGFYDTSSFMIGKIAVGIILPNGPLYNWTDAQVNQSISGIKTAMNFWASQDPGANLTFYFDTHIRVPTSYEPTKLPLSQDTIWITQVMNSLGYPGDAFAATRAYDNVIRKANNTDWAYTIFVVDNDPQFIQGRFADYQYAHALIGGPWLTMARLSSWAFNSNQYYVAVPSHETGHIFGATDEYDTALEYSGYLWTPDADGSLGLMNRNTLAVSTSTEAQVGHVDCNGDGIPDILERRPAIAVNSPPTVITSPVTTVMGEAIATSYPTLRPGGRDISIGRISAVQYSIDQGTLTDALLAPSNVSRTIRDFAFNITNPSGGSHNITIQAMNSAGIFASTTFTIQVPVGTPSFQKFVASAVSHHIGLRKSSEETLLADVNITGVPAYVYVQFKMVGGNNTAYFVTSQITRLSVGEETIIQTSWTPPPTRARYQTEATIFYSQLPIQPNALGWSAGPASNFTFIVTK